MVKTEVLDVGAGAVISRGAMERASFDDVHQYLTSIDLQSGDAMLTKAFWNVLNLAPTDPGKTLQMNQSAAPSWRWKHTGSTSGVQVEMKMKVSSFLHTGFLPVTTSSGELAVGYGVCRPGIQMFDPSWKEPRARGPEDGGTLDGGSDPIGMIDRFSCSLGTSSEALKQHCCSSDAAICVVAGHCVPYWQTQ